MAENSKIEWSDHTFNTGRVRCATNAAQPVCRSSSSSGVSFCPSMPMSAEQI